MNKPKPEYDLWIMTTITTSFIFLKRHSLFTLFLISFFGHQSYRFVYIKLFILCFYFLCGSCILFCGMKSKNMDSPFNRSNCDVIRKWSSTYLCEIVERNANATFDNIESFFE